MNCGLHSLNTSDLVQPEAYHGLELERQISNIYSYVIKLYRIDIDYSNSYI